VVSNDGGATFELADQHSQYGLVAITAGGGLHEAIAIGTASLGDYRTTVVGFTYPGSNGSEIEIGFAGSVVADLQPDAGVNWVDITYNNDDGIYVAVTTNAKVIIHDDGDDLDAWDTASPTMPAGTVVVKKIVYSTRTRLYFALGTLDSDLTIWSIKHLDLMTSGAWQQMDMPPNFNATAFAGLAMGNRAETEMVLAGYDATATDDYLAKTGVTLMAHGKELALGRVRSKIKLLKTSANAQSMPTGANTTLTWGAAEFNEGCIAGSTGITIQEAGYYNIGYEINMAPGTSSDRGAWMRVTRNGAGSYEDRRYGETRATLNATSTSLWAAGGTTLIYLDAGDLITVEAYHNDSGPLNVPGHTHSNYNNELFAFKIE
jgi:hypothetical protein